MDDISIIFGVLASVALSAGATKCRRRRPRFLCGAGRLHLLLHGRFASAPAVTSTGRGRLADDSFAGFMGAYYDCIRRRAAPDDDDTDWPALPPLDFGEAAPAASVNFGEPGAVVALGFGLCRQHLMRARRPARRIGRYYGSGGRAPVSRLRRPSPLSPFFTTRHQRRRRRRRAGVPPGHRLPAPIRGHAWRPRASGGRRRAVGARPRPRAVCEAELRPPPAASWRHSGAGAAKPASRASRVSPPSSARAIYTATAIEQPTGFARRRRGARRRPRRGIATPHYSLAPRAAPKVALARRSAASVARRRRFSAR